MLDMHDLLQRGIVDTVTQSVLSSENGLDLLHESFLFLRYFGIPAWTRI